MLAKVSIIIRTNELLHDKIPKFTIFGDFSMSQSDVIVQIFRISGHILEHFYERGEVNGFLFRNTFGFHHHQIAYRVLEGVDLEELTFPDKALTLFVDGYTVRIGLLQHLLVQVVVNLTLGLNHFGFADAFLRAVNIHHLTTRGGAGAPRYQAQLPDRSG